MAVQAGDAVPPWPVAETAGSAITSIHGEVLSHFDEASKASGSTLNKEILGKVDLYTKAIGRTAGVIDVAGKLYAGETNEAALSAGLTVLGELAGTEGGKAILGMAGLTTAPVTAAIFALQVGLASKKAVDDSTDALQLEILYASIERDPVLKNRSRDLGVGDPIPVTPQSIEYAWRKVYIDSQWQAGFKAYVVNELGKDWPEQSYWDQLTLPAGNSADQAALLDRSAEYKPYMASLLSQLNKLAQSREQFVVASRYLAQIKEALGQIPSDKALGQYIAVLSRRAEVIKFIAEANGQLTKPQSSDVLLALATKAKYHAQSMELLPTQGKIGAERQQLLADLRRIYDTAWSLRNKQANESASKTVVYAKEEHLGNTPGPTRYEGASAQEYLSTAENEFRQSKFLSPFHSTNHGTRYDPTFRVNSPAASELLSREDKAARKHYNTQILRANEVYKEFGPDAISKSFRKAAELFQSIDIVQINDAYVAAAAHITSLYLKESRNADVLTREIEQLESKAQILKKRSDKIHDIVSSYCQGADLSIPGYVGITSSFRIPPIDPLVVPADVSSKLTSYLYNQQLALLPYSLVSMCAGKSSSQGNDALSWLPSDALSLLDAKEVESAVALLQVQVESVQARVEAIKWYDEKEMDYNRQKVSSLVTKVRETHDGLKGADTTRGKILAFIPKLQTQLSNIENDRQYLERLRRIANFTPVYNGLRDLHGDSVSISSNYFLMRSGMSTSCSNQVGLRPLMSASDFDLMWTAFDRRMADARLTWLSEQYNLGLIKYLKEQFKKSISKAMPAGDYIYLGNTEFCRYYEPAHFEKIATAFDALPGSGLFLQKLAPIISYDDSRYIFGISMDLGGNYDSASLTKASKVADKSRALARDYWNAPTRDALAKMIKAYDAAIARYADYLSKDADYAALLAKISPLYDAFTSAEYNARQLYDKNSADPAALAMYRQAEGAGNAAVNAYRSASTNTKISPERQSEFARQTDYIILQLKNVTSMIRSLEGQISGRQEGQKMQARAEKVIAFYGQFKTAYERKDSARLMSMIANNWKASDGTRPSDVDTYFRNMFNVFDEIRFDISDIKVNPANDGKLEVSYSLSIKGFIYNINTEHEEKSSVTELVSSPDSGTVRIVETLQGRFWYP